MGNRNLKKINCGIHHAIRAYTCINVRYSRSWNECLREKIFFIISN